MTDIATTNPYARAPEFSVVIPVRNESENVGALSQELLSVLDGRAFEIVFVDDSSSDDTRARLSALKLKSPQIRIVGHRRTAGQSRAVRSGVSAARAPVVVTMDGDGQNDPADVVGMVTQLTRSDAPAGLALIQGSRKTRADSGWKKFGSRFANNVRRAILNDRVPDSGCAARAFRRDVYLELPYFDHMHRYLPALVLAEGYEVETRPVGHRRRTSGRSNYTNFGRLIDALSDLRGVMWLRKRRRSPGAVEEL